MAVHFNPILKSYVVGVLKSCVTEKCVFKTVLVGHFHDSRVLDRTSRLQGTDSNNLRTRCVFTAEV